MTLHATVAKNLPLFQEATRRATAAQVVARFRARQPAIERGFERDLIKLFQELGAIAERGALSVFQRRDLHLFEATIKATLTQAEREELVNAIMQASHLREWAGDRLTATFEKWAQANLNMILGELVTAGILQRGFIGGRQSMASNILSTGGRRAGLVDIAGDTKSAIFRALDQAQKEGLGPRTLARLIREIVPEGRFVNAGSAYRAQLIARTEMLHAQRLSSLRAYRTTPVIRHVVAFDGESDEPCATRNGSIFTLDDAEAEMMSDSVHPNCVLAFGPVTSG